jgi:TetR/AcrR family transcriptional repressor of nem operon
MRVSRAQVQQNRERILQEAARLFRERGFDAVGVADVMKAAGLTHGGFYGHFKSKDDLIAQAMHAAALPVLEGWREEAQTDGPAALKAIAGRYLSLEHRDDPAEGCLLAALGPEIARLKGAARGPVTEVAQGIVEVLQDLAPGDTQAERRRRAIALYAGWIGAMVLARASDDETFSREVLAAVAKG